MARRSQWTAGKTMRYVSDDDGDVDNNDEDDVSNDNYDHKDGIEIQRWCYL